MTETMTTATPRYVEHTPAELRRNLTDIANYARNYFPHEGEDWSGLNSWWANPDSRETIRRGSGLTARLIEAAYYENDQRDAIVLNELRSEPHFSTDEANDIDQVIHDEFPGPIPDNKMAKLRALAQERVDLRATVARLTAAVTEANNRALTDITDGQDERIRDLMYKAAVEADERGYCEVYDSIASAVGLWNRDDLGLSKRTYVFDLTATVNLTPDEADGMTGYDLVRDYPTSIEVTDYQES